jgi:predicted alpha/beta superfamily hydrolase
MKFIIAFAIILCTLISRNVNAQIHIKLDSIPISTPNNASIYIAGDFNDWNPDDENYQLLKQEDGSYHITIKTKEEIINYKFTLGSWDKVECDIKGNDVPNRISKNNFSDTIYAKVAAWKTDVKKTTCSANVHIIKEDFFIPQLNRTRKVWIYLPPDYEKSKISYPVLYMHDGQNLFDDSTSYAGEWSVDESLNDLFKKTVKGFIVVGINHGDSLRIEELTPWKNEQYGGGKGAEYAKFVVETLKPFIDKNYRTLSDKENTGVMGSSLGGLISFYMGLKYPNTFGKAGVFSPSFWFSDECYKMAEKFNKAASLRMYILAGGKEYPGFEEQIKKMEHIFRDKRSIRR